MSQTLSPSPTGPCFRQHWLSAAFLFTAAFINMLDTTIINLALPAIQTEFAASHGGQQWTLVIYVLTFAAGLLPFGRFGDVFGRRRLFLSGLSGVVVASTACGVAPSIEALIAARFLQGLSAAMMMPQVLAIIHLSFPEEEKAKAIGLFGMVTAMGAMVGPLLGGVLISADLWGLGWRMIFLINVPVGVVAFLGAAAVLPATPARESQTIDWLGAALFAGAAIALLYPVIEGSALGWPIWLAVPTFLSVVLALTFWQHQRRLAISGKPQLLPVGLLDNSRFLARIGIVTFMFIGIAGPIVVLAMVLQNGLGLSAAQAGVALAAHPTSIMAASLVSSRLGDRYLVRRVTLGMAALLAGMTALQVTISEATPIYLIWVPLIFVGAGVGTATVAMYQLVLKEVPDADAGAGSGALQASQQMGIALGIAVVGQIFFSALCDAPDAAAHAQALKSALWVPIALFASLCLLSLTLSTGETTDAAS